MTFFDYGVIIIIGISLGMGTWRGVVGELIAISAWVMAFLAARWFSSDIAALFFTHITDPDVRYLVAWIVIFISTLILMALVRMSASTLVRSLGLGVSDRLLGLVFGTARGLLVVLLLVTAGGLTSLPKQRWWAEAQLAPPLETFVLGTRHWLPDEIANRIQFR